MLIVGVAFRPVITSITAVPSSPVEQGDTTAVTVVVADQDTAASGITVELAWSPTAVTTNLEPIGTSPAGGPHVFNWDTTAFTQSSTGALFARGTDDVGPGSWFQVDFDLIQDPPQGYHRIEWYSPDDGTLWAQEEFLWYDPEYDPFSLFQHQVFEFGGHTTIRQSTPADPRGNVLTGSGIIIDDPQVKRIIDRFSGMDKTRDWSRAVVRFYDVWGMYWRVTPHFFRPNFPAGWSSPRFEFEYAVESAPARCATPGSGF